VDRGTHATFCNQAARINNPEADVKKEEAIDAIEQAGNTIHDLNIRVWTTALNPRQHGWGQSLLSIAAIPIVNAASIGQLVTSAVVKEVPAKVFDTVSNLGGRK
jgi:hypothetical protein